MSTSGVSGKFLSGRNKYENRTPNVSLGLSGGLGVKQALRLSAMKANESVDSAHIKAPDPCSAVKVSPVLPLTIDSHRAAPVVEMISIPIACRDIRISELVGLSLFLSLIK
jgi:hypothetical protein